MKENNKDFEKKPQIPPIEKQIGFDPDSFEAYSEPAKIAGRDALEAMQKLGLANEALKAAKLIQDIGATGNDETLKKVQEELFGLSGDLKDIDLTLNKGERVGWLKGKDTSRLGETIKRARESARNPVVERPNITQPPTLVKELVDEQETKPQKKELVLDVEALAAENRALDQKKKELRANLEEAQSKLDLTKKWLETKRKNKKIGQLIGDEVLTYARDIKRLKGNIEKAEDNLTNAQEALTDHEKAA